MSRQGGWNTPETPGRNEMASNWQALSVQPVRKNVFDVWILANFNSLLMN